jgi:lipopolysaccharide export system permease protein
MQFLWKYVDDLVGKGVDIRILGDFFFYAAIFSVPMALPIAVLLASLMTFGSLGEHFELLAMKSSGISLLRIMKPLIILVIFISGIAFVFQNNVLPGTQIKLWTLVYSIRAKTPELDIPVSSFYKGIQGYNIYVRHKDKTGLLRDVTIYDYYSKGFDKMAVIVSDSGRMKTSDDKKYLILTLYNGESFQNLEMNKSRYNQNQVPFHRQTFNVREILIAFDSNLNMYDESFMQDKDVSKNIPALRSFIRESSVEDDSVTQTIRPLFVKQVYTSTFKQERSYPETHSSVDTLPVSDFELFYNSLSANQQFQVLNDAKMKTDRLANDYNHQMYQKKKKKKKIRGHKIELHKKFSYSLACLLFFFIGAPLGAIIRKGGLGLPAVLSVFIFMMYYTVDLFGFKMARQDSWPIWEGMWLSSALLISLGTFLTYKSVNDSVLMNVDAWIETLQRFFGKREIRNYSRKEVIMNFPNYPEAIRLMEKWNEEANLYLEQKQRIPFYISFWKQNFRDEYLNRLLISLDCLIEDLLNSDENLIIGKLMDYPVIAPFQLKFLNRSFMRWSCSVLLPLGILIYIICFLKQRQINNDFRLTIKVNEEIDRELKNLKLNCVIIP